MTRINKRGPISHFTKEMDDFFLQIDEYETWFKFAIEFKRKFSRFVNNKVVADMPIGRLISKLMSRNQFLKNMKKEAK